MPHGLCNTSLISRVIQAVQAGAFWWLLKQHILPLPVRYKNECKNSFLIHMWNKAWTNVCFSDIKNFRFSECFRGIIQLRSALIFLRWFKLSHICIEVATYLCSMTMLDKQGIYSTCKFLQEMDWDFYLNMTQWLTMRSFTWNRFPIKDLQIDSFLKLFHM